MNPVLMASRNPQLQLVAPRGPQPPAIIHCGSWVVVAGVSPLMSQSYVAAIFLSTFLMLPAPKTFTTLDTSFA